MTPGIRVLIADDQQLFREGLRIVLTVAGVDVIGDVGSGQEAIELVERLAPDVVLMDLCMPLRAARGLEPRSGPRMDDPASWGGVLATRHICALPRAPRVIALTTFEDDESAFEILRAGALGYLLKDTESSRLLEAIELAARGESLLAPRVAAKVVAAFARSVPAPTRDPAAELGLSERERGILTALARGESNKEIASALRITEGTVKNHLTSVFSKLRVKDRMQAALRARDLGIL